MVFLPYTMKNNFFFRVTPDMVAHCLLLLATMAVFLASMATFSQWGTAVRTLASLAHAQGFYFLALGLFPALALRPRAMYASMGLTLMLLPHIMQ